MKKSNDLLDVNEEVVEQVTLFAALSAAATAGTTMAKYLGKRPVYGVAIAVGLTFLAHHFLKKDNEEDLFS